MPRAVGPGGIAPGARGVRGRVEVGASVERDVDHVSDVEPIADLRLVEDGAESRE